MLVLLMRSVKPIIRIFVVWSEQERVWYVWLVSNEDGEVQEQDEIAGFGPMAPWKLRLHSLPDHVWVQLSLTGLLSGILHSRRCLCSQAWPRTARGW